MRAMTICLIGLSAVCIAGCGGGGAGKPVKVEGKVTIDGVPITGATVKFLPEGDEGQPAQAITGDDGSFKLTTRNTGDGAVPGKYICTVTKAKTGSAASGMSDTKGDDYLKHMKDMSKNREKRTSVASTASGEVHANYADPKKSTLRFEVPSGGLSGLQIPLNKQGS
jgi:hypothetical protein